MSRGAPLSPPTIQTNHIYRADHWMRYETRWQEHQTSAAAGEQPAPQTATCNQKHKTHKSACMTPHPPPPPEISMLISHNAGMFVKYAADSWTNSLPVV